MQEMSVNEMSVDMMSIDDITDCRIKPISDIHKPV